MEFVIFIIYLLEIIYLFLPASFANMIPITLKKVPLLKHPVDFKLTFRERRILGDNKTFRGLVFGIIASIIIIYIQYAIQLKYNFGNFLIDYTQVNLLLLGFLMGFGALLGDMIESFVKRQLDIKPGDIFLFFDQTDWMIGCLALTSIYIRFEFKIWITAILLFSLLHIIIKHLSYYIGIENKKW